MNNSKTPLHRALEEYIDADWSRLHMPGHKGAPIEPFGPVAAYDVTEVEGTDSLFEDDGPLKELEELFTKLYGTCSTVLSRRIDAVHSGDAAPGGKKGRKGGSGQEHPRGRSQCDGTFGVGAGVGIPSPGTG